VNEEKSEKAFGLFVSSWLIFILSGRRNVTRKVNRIRKHTFGAVGGSPYHFEQTNWYQENARSQSQASLSAPRNYSMAGLPKRGGEKGHSS
jgi:hypothetical protein